MSRAEKSEAEDGEMGDSKVKAEEDETEESDRLKTVTNVRNYPYFS